MDSHIFQKVNKKKKNIPAIIVLDYAKAIYKGYVFSERSVCPNAADNGGHQKQMVRTSNYVHLYKTVK